MAIARHGLALATALPARRIDVLRAELERVLAGESPSDLVPDAVVASWRDSAAAGLRPDHLDLAYDGGIDFQSVLLRAATPVLDQVGTELARTRVSVILADDHGRVVERRVGCWRDEARLDRVELAPGYHWGLEHAGTNGLGVARATGAPALISGGEHFADALASVTTAGAPIRHPRTAQVLGVLGLVSWADAATELLLPLANLVGRQIERRLDDSSASERSLDDEVPRARLRPVGRRARPSGAHRPTFGWSSLTDTELAVSELVAEGRTNSEVAACMFVSRHTVDSHLRHIYCKLHITSRVELTRIVILRSAQALPGG
jgi:DNA-binding CsgD family transcriptional regulator